jgi:hypothetical protein
MNTGSRFPLASFLRGAIALVCVAGSLAALTPAATRLADAAERSDPTRAYWVFFRDRGTLTLDDATLVALAREISPETWARRFRAGTGMPDVRDLPLWPPYVEQVAAHGRLRHHSRWFNAVSIDLTAPAYAAVSGLPCVAAVRPVAVATLASIGPELDDQGQPLGTVLAPERIPAHDLRAPVEREVLNYGPSLGQLLEIHVPEVHALGYTGNRVRFMMIDTGFRKDHQAFAHTPRFDEWDFVFGDGQTQNEPDDDPDQHDHGTTTWSVAGGFAPGILIGPAYGASFALAKTEDIRSETEVEEDHYVAALERADSLGVAVTSASLNYLCFDDGFCYEFEDKDGDTAVITVGVDIAASRGILCVNSQGNYGCDIGSLGTPADADSMVAVGAVDSLNQITSFSACGPTYDGRIKPEVVARGRRTWGAGADDPDTYGPASGTSLSAPLVAGAAALLREAHPEWGPMDVRAALLATADRAEMPDNTYGWGRINTLAALHHTPLLHPYPFSLIIPADSATVSTLQPLFAWRASADPQGDYPLEYTLRITEVGNPAQAWEVAAGPDTTVVLPFALAPATAYLWEVRVATTAGYARLARETRLLIAPPSSSVAGPLAEESTAGALRLTLGANPVRRRLRFTVACPVTDRQGARDGMRWCLYDPLGRAVMTAVRAPARAELAVDVELETFTGRHLQHGVYYLEVRAGQLVAREALVVLGD